MPFLYKLITSPYHTLRWMMLTRPIRFTRFGTFYVLFNIGIGAAAINTGNNLLYLILGILLGFIIISGFLSDSGLWGITTDWAPLGSLYAGTETFMECRLRKGWFPGVAVTVESRWKGLPPLFSFAPWVPGHTTVSIRVPVTPARRGYLTLDTCHYSTRFPFGLFQKSHSERMENRWIAYPLVKRLPLDIFERQGGDPSRHSSSRQGLGSVPFVLRDYRFGDALRQVDWKTTAKRQRLIVKEMEDEANEGDLLYLDSWPIGLDSDPIEALISFIASLVFSLYERGRPVGLAMPGRLFRPAYSREHLHQIFEYLALVDPKQNGKGSSLPLEWNQPATDVLSLWRLYDSRR